MLQKVFFQHHETHDFDTGVSVGEAFKSMENGDLQLSNLVKLEYNVNNLK